MSKPRSLTEILAAKGGRSSHSHDQTESSTLAANTNGFASKSGREIEETEDEMQELEIPSSSTVLHDDSDLLQLLSGATINQNFEKDLSKVKIDVPDGSTQYDIIELYSTIAFLKKENQELRKEIEFSKKSKEAILKETNARYESQLEKMRTENQKYCEDFPLLENELNELRQINEALLQEKEELMEALNKLREKSSQSQEAISVRSELQAVKMENNRLKMEIARLKSDSDSFLQNDQ
jgi:chromosome segregation ATPase